MTVYNPGNIVNCRDLGGYDCPRGITAPGRALRCGIPKNPAPSDIEMLKNLGIKTIFDLRGKNEAAEAPSYFESDADFVYYNIPLLEANPSLNDTRLPIWKMYAMSLDGFRDGYRELFTLIGECDSPFLYHCFLGKDRTGIVTALLLGAAGVGREAIIADYCLSYKYLRPFIEKEIADNTGLIWEQDVSRLESRREYIEDTLKYIDCEYGGTNGFLLSAGLTEKQIEKAADKLF